MDEKNKQDDFAEIVISGGGNDAGNSAGFRIPPKGQTRSGEAADSRSFAYPPDTAKPREHSRYAGRGAYSWNSAEPKETLCFTYESELAFIGKVQVFSWGAKRSFYEKFREDALRYRKLSGEPSPHVPFFSYIPQYSQMNAYQSNFYLYFRDMARCGEYLRADLSYVLLYIYELINLSDISDPASDIDILCGLWLSYRDTYPALDKYMSEWVCDYCLLYRLPVPKCTLAILPKLCESATLREFYMSAALDGEKKMSGNVLASFADYDWRRSRVAIPPEFSHHFPAALEAACSVYEKEHFIGEKPQLVTRDAFCGSLCAHNVKRRLTVEYFPALRKGGIRHMLGAAVKYTENKLRRAAGIKSRLHIDGLPDNAKEKIDEYFAAAMPEIFSQTRKSQKQAPQIPEYERLYDAPDIPFSADHAAEIERSSRAAAELLSSSEDEAASPDIPSANPVHRNTDIHEHAPVDEALYTPEISADAEKSAPEDGGISEGITPALLRHMLEGGSLAEFCRSRGLFPDTAAAEVNEYAMDALGDVLLENTGDGWQIIVDYLEEAAEIAVSADGDS